MYIYIFSSSFPYGIYYYNRKKRVCKEIYLRSVKIMQNSCLFCKIIAGEIPSSKVYEDDKVYAFRDINPQAPVHVLVVPKTHIESADAIDSSTSCEVAAVFEAIPKVSAACGLTNGYRVITNVGEDGCQSVKHIHFHVLGGAKLPEDMGI